MLISYWISVLLNISLSYWLHMSLMIYTEQLVLLNISLSYFIGVLSNYLYWTFHCLIDHTSVIEHFTVLLNFNVLMTIVLFNISLSWNANETFIFVYLREILYLQQACICCISEYKCNKLTIHLYSIILLGFLKKGLFLFVSQTMHMP